MKHWKNQGITRWISALLLCSLNAHAAPFDDCPSDSFLIQGAHNAFLSIDLKTSQSTQLGYLFSTHDEQKDIEINAIGYSVHDDFIYGWNKGSRNLIRVHQDLAIEELPVDFQKANLPTYLNFYVGDVSTVENKYYAYRKKDGLYEISLDKKDTHYLSPKKIIDGTASGLHLDIFDLAFHPTNGFAYTVDNAGILYKIDVKTGQAHKRAELRSSFGNRMHDVFGALYFALDNSFYITQNSTGNIYRINNPDAKHPIAELFATSSPSEQNDGARCAHALITDDLVSKIKFHLNKPIAIFKEMLFGEL